MGREKWGRGKMKMQKEERNKGIKEQKKKRDRKNKMGSKKVK